MDWLQERRAIKWCVYASVAIVVVVTVVLVLVFTYDRILPVSEAARPDRIECPGLTEETCTARRCRYERASAGPSCFMEKDSFGYSVQSVSPEKDGPLLRLTSLTEETPYGRSLRNVIFKITYLTENIVRFQFKDTDNERYEVPVQNDFPLLQKLPRVDTGNLSYQVVHSNATETFNFEIKRNDGTKLWDSSIGGLLLSDQYLQIASYLPTANVYGLGEHVHETLRHKMDFVSWPMFSRDRFPVVPTERSNLYGVHPFYTCLEESGASHGVLLLNSNAMEATLLPAPAISFRTIGGILDFFVFVGDNPEHVIQLYTSLIGRPMLPPYWSLGFQLSKYGYNSLDNLKEAMIRTRKAAIPQAVQYLDIDHMHLNLDFTYDNISFNGLPHFIEETKNVTNLKWIIILDPTIGAQDGYYPYTSGVEKSVFVKRASFWSDSMFLADMQKENITYGKVWPHSYAAFPDFFQQGTKEWWKKNILRHRELISFDGLWIDMNEPANFETNKDSPDFCADGAMKPCWTLMCPHSQFEDPPYNPLLKNVKDRLSEKTLCMESVQTFNGTDYRHYDVHSLYGWSQTQPTLQAAQEATGTRSLVISRSTYPSSGRYAGHWLGDNASHFKDLKASLIGIMEFNLFGIPYIGADVCGFFEDATADLCKRWMQLGAFYPFYRNHNAMGQKDQDPGNFGEDVSTPSRKAIERRITLNPHLYTLFYRAHVDGSTVIRPVFHEFPKDNSTWDLGTQFMWGRSMMVTPILEENTTTVSVYLPDAEWWKFNYEKSRMEPTKKRYVTEVDADEFTPVHVRGGTIIPIGKYDSGNYPEEDFPATRDIDLYIFPENGASAGELFVDDGLSKDTIENGAYALYTFRNVNCTLTVASEEFPNFKGPRPILDKIVVFKAVSVSSSAKYNYSATVDEENHVAVLTLGRAMNEVKELEWQDGAGKCRMLA